MDTDRNDDNLDANRRDNADRASSPQSAPATLGILQNIAPTTAAIGTEYSQPISTGDTFANDSDNAIRYMTERLLAEVFNCDRVQEIANTVREISTRLPHPASDVSRLTDNQQPEQ